jgi:hypothetical protein
MALRTASASARVSMTTQGHHLLQDRDKVHPICLVFSLRLHTYLHHSIDDRERAERSPGVESRM